MRNPLVMERKISLRLDSDLVDDLQVIADRERVPLSYILRHLVLRFLRPSPPAGGLPYVGSLPAAQGGEGSKRFAPEGAAARRDAVSGRAQREEEKFRDDVLVLFDQFRAEGHDMKEATKRTNFTLKARNHPWATYEVVSDIIRKTGRYRKPKGRP